MWPRCFEFQAECFRTLDLQEQKVREPFWPGPRIGAASSKSQNCPGPPGLAADTRRAVLPWIALYDKCGGPVAILVRQSRARIPEPISSGRVPAPRMIRYFARTQERVQYIDVASAMFDTQGNLRTDLLVEDGLHPTRKCYKLWTSIIKPVLLQRFGLAKIVGQNAALNSAEATFSVWNSHFGR
jgi:hypothetical protein